MTLSPRTRDRLRLFLAAEAIVLGASAVAVLLPARGTTDLIYLPPSFAAYLNRVVLAFASLNGVLALLAFTLWIVWIVRGRPAAGTGGENRSMPGGGELP